VEHALGVSGVFFRARDPKALLAWHRGQLGIEPDGDLRVRDLDAMLARLRTAGAPVDDSIHENECGRFGWATDPEGHRFELWQPPSS